MLRSVQSVLLAGQKDKADVCVRLYILKDTGCLQKRTGTGPVRCKRIPLFFLPLGVIMRDNQKDAVCPVCLRVRSALCDDVKPLLVISGLIDKALMEGLCLNRIAIFLHLPCDVVCRAELIVRPGHAVIGRQRLQQLTDALRIRHPRNLRLQRSCLGLGALPARAASGFALRNSAQRILIPAVHRLLKLIH